MRELSLMLCIGILFLTPTIGAVYLTSCIAASILSILGSIFVVLIGIAIGLGLAATIIALL